MYICILSLNSAIDGEVFKTMFRPFYPPRERYMAHCIRGCVDPRTGLDGCGKTRSYQDSNSGPSSAQRVAISTELYRPTMIHCFLIFVSRILQQYHRIPSIDVPLSNYMDFGQPTCRPQYSCVLVRQCYDSILPTEGPVTAEP